VFYTLFCTLLALGALTDDVLPDGWDSLPVADYTSVFQTVDGDTLRKIVFPLPIQGVVLAFDPSATHISVEEFLTLKQKMPLWPFCRDFVLRPRSVALPIHGSAQAYDAFVAALSPLRPLLLSREDVNALLRPESPHPVPTPAPLGGTDARLRRLELALDRLLADRENPRLPPDDSSDGASDQDFGLEPDRFSDDGPSETSEWHAPPLLPASSTGDPFSFSPKTEE